MGTANFLLGMDAKLYQGDEDEALSILTEVTNVKDLTLTLEAGEADVTTRGNSGWRATASTLRSCTAEWQMVWKPTDDVFTAIKTAFLTNALLRLAILTGERGVANSEGPQGDFAITNFSRNEALEEGVIVSVTAKMADFDQWIEDGAEAGS